MNLHQILLGIAGELRTQDNLATHEPIFMVQRHVRTYGFDPSYSDNCVYLDEDYVEVKINAQAPDGYECPKCNAALGINDMDDECCSHCDVALDLGNWCLTRTAYQDTWVNVQPFFTRAGAEAYLQVNGHNLRSGKEPPRIYVESAFRNEEWQSLRRLLMSEEFRLWCTNMSTRPEIHIDPIDR